MIPGENGAKRHRLNGTAGVRILGRSTEANGTTAGPTHTTRAGSADRCATEVRADPAEVCWRAGFFLFTSPCVHARRCNTGCPKEAAALIFFCLGGMPGEALAYL